MTEPKYIARWRDTRKESMSQWREVKCPFETAKKHVLFWGNEGNRMYVSDIQVLKDGKVIFNATRDGNEPFTPSQLAVTEDPIEQPKLEVKRSVLEI